MAPSRSRKAPASLTRARRLPEADIIAGSPTETKAAAEKPAPQAPTSSPPTPAPNDRRQKTQRTVNVFVDLLERARAAATYLGAYEADAKVRNLSDLVNPGLEQQVKALEDKYNKGKPFRAVARMQPGRPPQT